MRGLQRHHPQLRLHGREQRVGVGPVSEQHGLSFADLVTVDLADSGLAKFCLENYFRLEEGIPLVPNPPPSRVK